MAGLHFVLVPLVAQGHIIPMVDLARLLAARGARATVVTTPVNAARNRASIDGARAAGLDVELAEIPFPGPEHGLPEGLENVDQMSEKEMFLPFFKALWRMDAALDAYVRSLLAQGRRPDCVVADSCNPWAASVCARHGVPRLVLHCPSAYYLLAEHNLSKHGVYGRVADELEEFEVPDFPVRAVGNAATFRGFFQWPGAESERRDIIDAEASADGLIVNTFRDAEGVFVDGYAAALGKKTWALPVMNLPAEAEGVQVTSADVEKAVAELMDEGAEGTARRERAKDLADKARAAMEEGGSSYEYLSDMIRYVAELSRKKSQERDASASAAQLLPSAPELGGSNKSGKIQAEAARLSVQS
ncbi:hypothetical protein EJB05_31213, partial [Eragrostis curvula]